MPLIVYTMGRIIRWTFIIFAFFYLSSSYAKTCLSNNGQLSLYLERSLTTIEDKLKNWRERGEVYESYSLQMSYDRLIEYLFVCERYDDLLLIERKVTKELKDILNGYGFRCMSGTWCSRRTRHSKIIPLAVAQFSYFYFKINWMKEGIKEKIESESNDEISQNNIQSLMVLQLKIMRDRVSTNKIRDIDILLYLNSKYYEGSRKDINVKISAGEANLFRKMGEKVKMAMIIDKQNRLIFNADMHVYVPYNNHDLACSRYKAISTEDLGWDISHSRRINYLFNDYKKLKSMQPIFTNEGEYISFRSAYVNRLADLFYEDEGNLKLKNYFNGYNYCYKHPSGRVLAPGQAINIVNDLGYSDYAHESEKLKYILESIKDKVCEQKINDAISMQCINLIVKQ